MESGIKRTQCDYTLAFKLSAVNQIEKGELTYKEAQRRYVIQVPYTRAANQGVANSAQRCAGEDAAL
jgi:hypothetical protein